MTIWVDENIPLAEPLFGQLGEVRLFSGRGLQSADLKGAEALIVRSVTPVNRALLADSKVRFVGTATIGVDHLDMPWLQERGITYCSAPGSNAQSVAEYVLSALAALDSTLEALVDGGQVGIIGFGNVGRQLARCLTALGISYRAYDPWLDPKVDPGLADLDTVTASQVVCCHAPLISGGRYPSRHMLGLADLERIGRNGVLLNAGRGGVLATDTLLALRQRRPDIALALDVWEGEPAINQILARACAIATPHIAGYSLDGKVRGAVMIARALAVHLDKPLSEAIELESPPHWALPSPSLSKAAFVRALIHRVYDVRDDDRRFRAELAGRSPAAGFDRLRKTYPVRRELAACKFEGAAGPHHATLQGLISAADGL